MNLRAFTGRRGISPHWDEVLAHDVHSPGTVDAVLLDRMVHLRPETEPHLYARFTPTRVRCSKGARPFLESVVQEAVGRARSERRIAERLTGWCHQIPSRYPTPARSASRGFYRSTEDYLFGGTEEELIKKGTEWCTETARVLCVLAQVAGIPARLVFLFSLETRFGGHCVNELFVDGAWAAFDAGSNSWFARRGGRLASVADIRRDPAILERHPRFGRHVYLARDLYTGAAAIADYFVADHARYDYSWDTLNDYYRKILGISPRGRVKIEIQPMDAAHAAAVRRLAPQAGLEPPEVAHMLGRAEVHIALVEREMSGFIALEPTGRALEVVALVVAAKVHRRGVGTRLLRFAERQARRRGLSAIRAATTNDNIPALALYQKAGFRLRSIGLGAAAAHHGREERGWSGLPVRDEITLVKRTTR